MELSELRQLHRKAVAYCEDEQPSICNWVYRNQSQAYFEDVKNNNGGLMKVVPKDRSGDPRSPINGGQISGLFFMARNEGGQPQPKSPFGPCRLQVPPNILLDVASNIFFTDFYCMQGETHYVTLVMTKPGSSADIFCRHRLLRLNLNDQRENSFFLRQHGMLHVSCADCFQVCYNM